MEQAIQYKSKKIGKTSLSLSISTKTPQELKSIKDETC